MDVQIQSRRGIEGGEGSHRAGVARRSWLPGEVHPVPRTPARSRSQIFRLLWEEAIKYFAR